MATAKKTAAKKTSAKLPAPKKRQPVVKYPKAIGACVDLLYMQRARRLDLGRQVDILKAEETAFSDYIINQFSKDEINGCRGEVATGAIKVQNVVSVVDWDKALAWVIKNKRYDLLTKGLSSDGVKELWAAGKEIPGAEPFGRVSLSLTKV